MSILGLNLQRGQLRGCVLDGTKAAPNLVGKERLVLDPSMSAPHKMRWYEDNLNALHGKYGFTGVAYRLHYSVNQTQATDLIMPLGVLNLFCNNSNIPISEFIAQNVTALKLGLPKGSNLYGACDSILGSHAPYWDKVQKDAALVAWMVLP